MRRTVCSIFTVILAAFVGAGCGSYGKVYTGDVAAENADTVAAVSTESFDAKVKKRDGCGDIEDLKDEGSTHVEEPVDYTQNPPSSGNHNPVPLDWGLYNEEQDTENWVHNMEHGHIVITYKGLSKKDLAKLTALRDKSKYHIVMLPRKANPKDGVYFNAWTHRLYCKKPSAPALQEFKDRYLDQGPELFTNDRKMPDQAK